MIRMQPIGLSFWMAILISSLQVGWAQNAFSSIEPKENISFEKQIRPLLKQHCYDCHSQETEESGLRLDYGAEILKGGDRGAVIVPGKSAESILFMSLLKPEKMPRMPHDLPPLNRSWKRKMILEPKGQHRYIHNFLTGWHTNLWIVTGT